MAKTRAKTNAQTNALGRSTPVIPVRKQPVYTRVEKIAAVTTLLGHGGVTVEGIAACRLQLNTNISQATLSKWLIRYKDEVLQAKQELALIPAEPRTVDTVRTTQANLVNDLIAIQQMLVDSVKNNPAQMDEASTRDKLVGIGITLDKLERWLAQRPGVRERWNKLEEICLPAGLNPDSIFDDFLNALATNVAQLLK